MLPKYIADELAKMPWLPGPLQKDIQPNQRIFENVIREIFSVVRNEFPELLKCDFYLFGDEHKEVDGIFSYMDHIRPVIGCRVGVFDPDANQEYQRYVIMHELAHRMQPLDDVDEMNSFKHGEIFHACLWQLLKRYNKRYDVDIRDYDDYIHMDGSKRAYRC